MKLLCLSIVALCFITSTRADLGAASAMNLGFEPSAHRSNLAFSFAEEIAAKQRAEADEAPATTTTQRVTSKRTVKPGPKCYYCLNNCTEDYTSDVVKTCTADQICVRKMIQTFDKQGRNVIQRSSGCTYQCKIGVIVSSSFNQSVQCCESYLDKRCSVREYTAAALQTTDFRLPRVTILVVGILNLFAGYFF